MPALRCPCVDHSNTGELAHSALGAHLQVHLAYSLGPPSLQQVLAGSPSCVRASCCPKLSGPELLAGPVS